MNKAVFLDRDGTINEEMGYINHESRFKVFDFVPEAIRILNEAQYKVFVITNQAGVARGYFEESLLKDIHDKFIADMQEENAVIEKIYYCPHHPSEGKGKYKKDCNCRKPNTGMIDLAVNEYKIDLNSSFMVGDRYKDMEFAHKAGLHSVFVKTGYGMGEFTYQSQNWNTRPTFIAKNLLEAARYISLHPVI